VTGPGVAARHPSFPAGGYPGGYPGSKLAR